MQDLMIRTHLVASDLRDRAVERLRSDRGQTTAEYVGVILLLVAVIAAVSQFGEPIGGAIKNAVKAAIDRVKDAI